MSEAERGWARCERGVSEAEPKWSSMCENGWGFTRMCGKWTRSYRGWARGERGVSEVERKWLSMCENGRRFTRMCEDDREVIEVEQGWVRLCVIVRGWTRMDENCPTVNGRHWRGLQVFAPGDSVFKDGTFLYWGWAWGWGWGLESQKALEFSQGLRVQRTSAVFSKGILCIDVKSGRDELLAKGNPLMTIQKHSTFIIMYAWSRKIYVM